MIKKVNRCLILKVDYSLIYLTLSDHTKRMTFLLNVN